jgi:phage-related protein (TIGR01555 family)
MEIIKTDSGLTDVMDRANIPIKESDLSLGLIIDDVTALELYRSSSLIKKIVNAIPEVATEKPFNIDLGASSGEGVDIYGELEKIPCSIHRNGFREEFYGINEAFFEADQMARLFGNSYIFMGINDGQTNDQPVNINNITSIDYLYVLSHQQLTPDGANNRYTYSRNIQAPESLQETFYVHPSRVLRFYGSKIPSGISIGTYQDDSIIQSVYNSFIGMSGAVGASRDMLQKHSAFIYAIKGFKETAKLPEGSQRDNWFKAVFKGILDGIGRTGGVLMDADSTASFINRNYGGVDTLVDLLMNWFVAHSGLPRSKLLGSSNSSAFSEGGFSDRMEFASAVSSYQSNHYKSKLKTLISYYLVSKQSIVKKVDKWDISFPSVLVLTPKEQADLEKTYAESDTIRIRDGVLTENEVRQSRYSGTNFGTIITLDINVTSDLIEQRRQEKMTSQNKLNQQQQQPIIKTDSGDKIIINGVVLPLSEYESMYDIEEMGKLEDRKIDA